MYQPFIKDGIEIIGVGPKTNYFTPFLEGGSPRYVHQAGQQALTPAEMAVWSQVLSLKAGLNQAKRARGDRLQMASAITARKKART